VAGEAAGLALGLVMLGSAGTDPRALEEMLQYAHDTQHEKIIRGLSVGLALLCFGLADEANQVIEVLSKCAVLLLCGRYRVLTHLCG
jgi:26S proteasome regulatory subunit N2